MRENSLIMSKPLKLKEVLNDSEKQPVHSSNAKLAALVSSMGFRAGLGCCIGRKRKKNFVPDKLRQPTSGDSRKNSTECMLTSVSFRDFAYEEEEEYCGGALVFSYRLLQLATDNFNPANVIGHGGFGRVYKGYFPHGQVVAIKQLDRDGRQGEAEFRMEVGLLRRLKSPYLLNLLGYCSHLEQRLLVYEFMPKGNLHQQLYPNDGSSRTLLDWEKRMKIALNAARALEYLHEFVTPPVIHRDFKSTNILLDENFNAKVSDFGLAKLGSYKMNGLVHTRVLGTQGYVAPEYILTGHLTTKSDVYSFGVVLLELLTGRVPVDMKRPIGQGVLVSWALPRLTDRQKLLEIVDPSLEGKFSVNELVQVAAIAAMCVQPEADYRPLMTDVVQSLIPLAREKAKQKTIEKSFFSLPS